MATVGVKGLKISNLYTVVCVHVYADEVLFFIYFSTVTNCQEMLVDI